MHQFSKWAAAGILAFSALSPLGAFADSNFNANRTDFRDETIYFAMTTRFYDGDPTNNVLSWDKADVQKSKNDPDWRGDFAGLIEKLDYIKALGFTAIWITPIVQNASGEDYHGYHAMDFSSVDLRYESRTDWGASRDVKFQDLINAAHAKGIKIVLDIVLQHTGNFGEVNLNPLFERDQDIRNQASPATALIPNTDKLSSNYFEQSGEDQYKERWKYFKNPQYEPNNYYHHYGTGWNWDLPNRWWGQIAGDCVDLNTENNYVAEYIVKCYGEFIKMGVDGFRIDTAGHISPLTFNKQFIPQFHKIAEENKSKRLNECPFFMFGEVCQRFQGSVVYRDQPNLSSYFYTWKSDQSLLDQFNGDPAWWKQQTLPEGHDTPVGPMAICEKDTQDKPRSNNAKLVNNQWHEPDYSQASGFSVIDFPIHYSFGSVGNAFGLTGMDNYYNDATYNVVYVDSHDYCPGPNDGTRFNGGTAQWAENLSFMFTFRGIPCIYYGSEVEFKKGLPIDVGGENNKTPRSQSGRAYFGNYLEGNVEASDFCTYTASGNVAKTLDADLAQHIRRLNQIRQAVPALRKGQYTTDGCSANGGWAYKRAYKDNFALVAVNGGATFTNVPSGTYTDLVTGQTYTGSTITVDAPKTQGQLRVLVKDWNGGIVGEDGKFIYKSSPVNHGGSVEFDDPGVSQYWTAEDAPGPSIASVKFNPNGGTFKTETLSVTVTLSDAAAAGWYQIAGKTRVNLSPSSRTHTFTIGEGMNYGETVTVTWGATNDEGAEKSGSVTYKKIDPNASITVYVKGPDGSNIYSWGDQDGTEVKPTGAWPGSAITTGSAVTVGSDTYYGFTFDGLESVNVIFNKDGAQTADISGITEDVYYSYDGGSTAEKVDVNVGPVIPQASVTLSPNGGRFDTETITVTATANNAVSAWYQIGNGDKTSFTSTTQFTLGENMQDGESVTVKWGATNSEGTEKQGSATYTKQTQGLGGDDDDVVVITGDYNLCYNGSHTNVHFWGGSNPTTWPGVTMDVVTGSDGNTYRVAKVGNGTTGIVFNGNGGQTGDLTYTAEYVMNDNGASDIAVKFIGGSEPDPIDPDPIDPDPVDPDQLIVYYDNSTTNWNDVYVHYWGASETKWPGVQMQKCQHGHFYIALPAGTTGVVFNGNNGSQSGDVTPEHTHIYTCTGNKDFTDKGVHECAISGVDVIEASQNDEVKIFNLQGVQVTNPGPGIYIVVRGKKTSKIRIN